MDLQRATLVSAAMLLGVVGASDVLAGGGGNSGRSGQGGGPQHHGHATGGHPGTGFGAPYPARVYPRAAYLATAIAYAPAAYYYSAPPAYYRPPVAAHARPAVYYVPPIDPNSPLFSFNGGALEPEWNWQRVSLQQLVAEVRAKREAVGKP